MTPRKTRFGVDASEAWNEQELEKADEEQPNIALHLSLLHCILIDNAKRLRGLAAGQYDPAVVKIEFDVGNKGASLRPRILYTRWKRNRETMDRTIRSCGEAVLC